MVRAAARAPLRSAQMVRIAASITRLSGARRWPTTTPRRTMGRTCAQRVRAIAWARAASSPISSAQLAGLLRRIQDNTISGKIAKEVFAAMWNGEGEADAIIEARGLKQVSDSGAIEKIIDEIIAANPGQVAEYRSGKDKLFGFFVGQAMKASKGKANPAQLNEILKQKLAG